MFFWYSLIFIAGLTLGSYLNSWMWRVHEPARLATRSVAGGNRLGSRSVCIHCNRALAWYENIPLCSFLVLRGKCRTCRKPIPADYFLVELVTALLFVGITYYHLSLSVFSPWHFFRDVFFAALLIVVFIYDLKYYIILPGLVLAGAVVAFIINIRYLTFSIQHLAIGLAIGGGFFLLQYVVSKGRWIGKGDIYLGVMMGALLGWPVIVVALFLSYVLGALVSVPLLVSKKKNLNSEVPFGTFLAVGTLAAMFWGEPIVRWYSGLLK
ncbi:MAG: prepilin peptidase [Candidatus Magasanikbacteria bacterium]|nr:prepilin peptidase [Candidatus Magasanikbacteria bacterium]